MVLRLQGGLGNQLFQLLAMRYLLRTHTGEQGLVFPDHLALFKAKREMSINPFLAHEELIWDINWFDEVLFRTKASRLFSKLSIHAIESVDQLNRWKGQHLNGYFQDIYNYKDFEIVKEEIKKLDAVIVNATQNRSFDISETDCALHLRLTDFVETKEQKEFLLNYRVPYLKQSMRWFKENRGVKRFVLFTDSQAEAKKLINGNNVVVFQERIDETHTLFDEFCTFCSFSNMIGSNSTFSFWGSILGQKKQVVFPAVWDKLRAKDNEIFNRNLAVYDSFSYHNHSIVRL